MERRKRIQQGDRKKIHRAWHHARNSDVVTAKESGKTVRHITQMTETRNAHIVSVGMTKGHRSQRIRSHIQSDNTNMARYSSVGIATRYWLDGLRHRIPVQERFSAPVQTGPGTPPSLLYNGLPGLSRG